MANTSIEADTPDKKREALIAYLEVSITDLSAARFWIRLYQPELEDEVTDLIQELKSLKSKVK